MEWERKTLDVKRRSDPLVDQDAKAPIHLVPLEGGEDFVVIRRKNMEVWRVPRAGRASLQCALRLQDKVMNLVERNLRVLRAERFGRDNDVLMTLGNTFLGSDIIQELYVFQPRSGELNRLPAHTPYDSCIFDAAPAWIEGGQVKAWSAKSIRDVFTSAGSGERSIVALGSMVLVHSRDLDLLECYDAADDTYSSATFQSIASRLVPLDDKRVLTIMASATSEACLVIFSLPNLKADLTQLEELTRLGRWDDDWRLLSCYGGGTLISTSSKTLLLTWTDKAEAEVLDLDELNLDATVREPQVIEVEDSDSVSPTDKKRKLSQVAAPQHPQGKHDTVRKVCA
jgi:hypothetical protein